MENDFTFKKHPKKLYLGQNIVYVEHITYPPLQFHCRKNSPK